MSLSHWGHPFKDLENHLNYMNRLNRAESWPTSNNKDTGELTVPDWAPRVDIKETAESYVIKAELPGVNKNDVSVTLEQGVLTLRGEKKFEKEYDDEKTHRVECSYGSFVRSFSLPESVDENKVTAKYKDGLLNLIIPKAQQAKQKSIEINVE